MQDLTWNRVLVTGAAGKIGATLRAGPPVGCSRPPV